MPVPEKEQMSVLAELTGAQAVQAVLTLIVTTTLMILIVLGRDIPDFLTTAFFVLLGVYMELPSKASQNTSRP